MLNPLSPNKVKTAIRRIFKCDFMQTKFFVATDLDLENVFVFICEMLRIDSVDRVCVGLCATRACVSVRASTDVRLAIYQQTGSICVTISL